MSLNGRQSHPAWPPDCLLALLVRDDGSAGAGAAAHRAILTGHLCHLAHDFHPLIGQAEDMNF